MKAKIRSLAGGLLDWAGESPFWFVGLIMMLGVFLSVAVYLIFPRFSEGYFEGVFVEFSGMLFDIAVFGLLIAFVARRQIDRDEIKRQQEIIDDFKSWGSDEAQYRIAGAIRRIAKLGSTRIDFRGIKLKDFAFSNHGINDLSGSKFADGYYLDELHRVGAELEDVSFMFLNARGCVFSKTDGPVLPGNLRGKNLTFSYSDLEGASFEGATLKWDKIVQDESDWHEEVGEDDDGIPYFHQVYHPPFEHANLRKVSFRGARLENADFRGAKNVADADFVEVKGLDSCRFDEEDLEQIQKQLKRVIKDQHPPSLF